MEVQNQTNKPYSSGVFMQIVVKYKKHLLSIGIIAIIFSAIFSSPYFITPLYKSIVILYPTASKSISKALLAESFGNTKDILEFGEEEQTEQMLQVLNSNKIRDKVIRNYNLLEHYNISTESKYKMTKLFKMYDDNFRFRRTEFMAVQITVYDKDAQLAADMANDIAELVDSTINQMQKEVAVKAFRIVKTEYNALKAEVQLKEDSLTVLREFGVHDYESQSEMFNRQLAIEMANGNTAGIRRLEKKLEILAKYGGPYVSLRDALEHDKKQLSKIKARYDEAKVDATESLPHKFIVSNAYKAEKKSYPIRWIIVIITTFSALFLAIVLFGAFEVSTGRMSFEVKKKSIDIGKRAKEIVFNHKYEERKPLPVTLKDEPKKETKVTTVESKKVEQKETEGNKEVKVVLDQHQITPTETRKEVKREHKNIEMDSFFNSSNLLNLVWKWKYHLLIIIAVAALFAAIFSGPAFITPMFKSYAIAYPANVDSYSEESETEQMLQIINSQDIVDSVINRFDLATHYEIDKNYKYFKTVLFYEYHQNVSVGKTLFESVMIEVNDKSPDTAMQMVNAILEFYNMKVARLHKSKYVEVADMYEKQLTKKRAYLDSLKQVMIELGTEYGIFEYEFQSQEIMRGYLKTVMGQNGSQINTKEVERLLESMKNKSGQLIEVVQMIQDESRTYVEVKLDYEMAIRFLDAEMTYTNIVTYPFASDKKSYPIRWLIVVVVTLAALVFAMLVILFLEKRKLVR